MAWAEEEFGGAVLGDARLTGRLVRLADDLSSNPAKSIPVACAGPAEVKAAYRLLDNEGLDWRAVLEAHGQPTAARMAGETRVLCIQDTTELDFSSQQGIAGLGRLTYERQHGMYLHPTLAVSEGGVALGVLDAWMWARKPKGEADIVESLRWAEGYERVAELAARLPGTRLLYVADREGDLRELIDLAAETGHAADYLVRAKHDRALEGGGKLRDEVGRQVPLGEVEFRLPPAPGRKERTVTQTVRVARVGLARRGGKTREVTAILAREESPPPGEKPVEWLLLTNEKVETLDAACLRVAWYRKRWLVEVFFRILKSGCRVEALQLATRERLERALALYLVIAWRVLHLVTLGRGCPDLPCDVAFSAEEWRAAWAVAKRQPPPDAPPSLGEMVRIVAGFGGFLGRKGDGHPGPKALWEGLQKLMAYVEAFQAAREVYREG
ncbi:Transposase for transposon Tn5 [Planctomycetaceae bacterium]|nr:Transposase for transposon Tn5 [Planctomycetaceae bacterium]